MTGNDVSKSTLDCPGYLSAEAFRTPDIKFVSAWTEHTPFAMWLVEALRPAVIVELGTLHGNSYLTFCDSISRLNIPAQCFGFDTRSLDDIKKSTDAGWSDLSFLSTNDYSSFSTLAKASSREAAAQFLDGSVDMLHIDGRDFYDDVLDDFNVWLPKISNKGLILLHDTAVRDEGHGVHRLMSELRHRFATFEFTHGHGLGLIAIGAEIAPKVRALIDVGSDQPIGADIRRAYARLGRAVVDHLSLRTSSRAIYTLRQDLTEKESLVRQQREHLSDLGLKTSQAHEALAVELSDSRRQLDAARSEAEAAGKMATAQLSDLRLAMSRQAEAAFAETAQLRVAAHAQVTSFEAEAADLRSAADEAAAEIEELRVQTATIGDTARTLSASLVASQQQEAAGRRRLAGLSDERDRLNAHIQRLTSSTSWRLTAPLRIVAHLRHPRAFVRAIRSYLRDRKEARSLRTSGLIDPEFYLSQVPDVARAKLEVYWHYVRHGAREGRNPNPYFDTAWYLSQNPDVAETNANPLFHYFTTGSAEGRDPSVYFDTAWYLEHYGDQIGSHSTPLLHFMQHGVARDLNPTRFFDASWYRRHYTDIGFDLPAPLAHYITLGAQEGRSPSPYFSSSWYRATYSDLGADDVDPLSHYITTGLDEARSPNPYFNTRWYLDVYPDVSATGVEPLLHYQQHAAAENRKPSPYFEPRWYLDHNPDVADAGIEPLLHYMTEGWQERRSPSPYFDLERYLLQHPDVAAANEEPWAHYIATAAITCSSPSLYFDTAWYLQTNPDVAASGAEPLFHYITEGAREGRRPNPFFDPTWYLEQDPNIDGSTTEPLFHYITIGAAEGRNPSADFDAAWYIAEHGLSGDDATNVLLHHLSSGDAAGLATKSSAPPVPRGVKTPGAADDFGYMPLVSVITPVFNVDPKWLTRCVASVQAQTYARWEMCICDDGSSSPATIQALERLANEEPRLKLKRSPINGGISAATNEALALAEGDYVALLDNDDELAPDAIAACVAALNANRRLDVIYSDENKISESGRQDEPFLKPDWSPSLFREVMYIGHLLFVRRSLILDIGGCDRSFDGVQDFELMLRLSERTSHIHHIPRILYHWRRIQGSIASSGTAKPDIGIKQVAAVNAHLQRLGIKAQAEPQPHLSHRTMIVPLPVTRQPKVSIVIPTKDGPDLIKQCLESIRNLTTYDNYEIVVVDNASTDQRALSTIKQYSDIHIVFDQPFNYSKANNVGVAKATGDLIVLLNNDTEVVQGDWLEQLAFFLVDPQVKAVSPMLTYPDGTVQHAGVALGLRGTADHVLRGQQRNSDGYFGSLACTREVSAVTFACAMMRRQDYLALGGLRELYQTHYQDVDFCLRLREGGGRILYTPRTRLVHFESASRGTKYDLTDRALLLDSWQAEIAEGDRYSRWESPSRAGDADL